VAVNGIGRINEVTPYTSYTAWVTVFGWSNTPVCNQPTRATQPPALCGTRIIYVIAIYSTLREIFPFVLLQESLRGRQKNIPGSLLCSHYATMETASSRGDVRPTKLKLGVEACKFQLGQCRSVGTAPLKLHFTNLGNIIARKGVICCGVRTKL